MKGTFVKMEATLDETDSVTEVKADLTKTMKVLGGKNIIEKAYFEL